MSERRRLLVTGSQNWDDLALMRRPLYRVWNADPATLLVSGGCPRGADLMAETFWTEMLGGDVERHPVEDWYDEHGQYDPMKGKNRSTEMVKLGAWGCVAFGLPCERTECRGKKADTGWPFHVTHGTEHCARTAAAFGIPVKRYTPILSLWRTGDRSCRKTPACSTGCTGGGGSWPPWPASRRCSA
jgi:YspA, cpYpsA-related SLOG family